MQRLETGYSILVVDDEWLIAMAVQSSLTALGHEVIGPAPSVAAALQLIEKQAPDGALLDISLGREKSFPVAEALEALDVPYAFVTGYAENQLPPRFADRQLLQKPVDEHALKACLSTMMRDQSAGTTRSKTTR